MQPMSTPSPPAGDESSSDDSVSPAIAVVRSIASATGRQPHELAPLYDSIDPDALDALFEHARDRSASTGVSFSHDGVEVELCVSPDGGLTVDVGPA